jgi:hypothetical protein
VTEETQAVVGVAETTTTTTTTKTGHRTRLSLLGASLHAAASFGSSTSSTFNHNLILTSTGKIWNRLIAEPLETAMDLPGNGSEGQPSPVLIL